MEFLRKALVFIKQKKYIILVGSFVLLIAIGSISQLAILRSHTSLVPPSGSIPTNFPNQIQALKILSTNPVNGQTNVSTGEILISFVTTIPVASQKTLSITITPPIPYYWKFENLFPSTNIKIRIYGGLKPNTQYTVSVKDTSGNLKDQWSFSTSNESSVSSPLIGQEKTKQVIHDQFPLLPYLPYSTPDFYIDYQGGNVNDNTLEVDIENPHVTQDQVKQEVNNWIKSKGVDPSTQKINYVNDF